MKNSKNDDKMMSSPNNLPCQILGQSPQVIYQDYVFKKHEKKNKIEKKYCVVYGYRLYFYSNYSDPSFKAMYFLRNELLTVQNKAGRQMMVIQVNEADLKEKFYLNPKTGFETEVCIEMDTNGQMLKMHLENILSYRNLVDSKAKIHRLIELNSKLVSFYQDSSRSKLLLEYFGE